MYLLMDLLDNLLSTHPIQTGCEIPIHRNPNVRFRFIYALDRQIGTMSGSYPDPDQK